MTEQEVMKLFNVTPEQLDKMAKPYEDETFELEDGEVFTGSHLDKVCDSELGSRQSVTIDFDAEDTQKVNRIAEMQGVKPASIYRAALKTFLANKSVPA